MMALSSWKRILLLLVVIQVGHLAPLDPKSTENEGAEEQQKEEGQEAVEQPLGLEYEGYLKDVIQVLETDTELKAKMDEMDTNDLLSGALGKMLHNVGNHVRTQLDELKRKEIQRLRIIARKKMEETAVGKGKMPDQKFLENLIAHLDPSSMESFSPDDMTKLIQKATKDLEENDRERRKEFKRYEMEKELTRRSELRHMDAKQREEAEKAYKEEREKLQHHKKVNHPGSKKQLEEVWEKTDHLDRKDFNPKTFFFLHDSNTDGMLDAFELEALFIKEVEKIYQGQKNVDMQEKFEELSRMREHVVTQIDLNKDKMVSLEEFMQAAAASEFDEDSEWQDLNKEDQFTEQDLEAYQNELRRTLEDTKKKMAEAGDNFVRVRQPQRQGEPIVMDQRHAEKIKDDLTKGLPPLDGNKLRFGNQPPSKSEEGNEAVKPNLAAPPGGQPGSRQQVPPNVQPQPPASLQHGQQPGQQPGQQQPQQNNNQPQAHQQEGEEPAQ